ncbi:DUF2938 domain-containing protein, partial [Pseudoalteromonas sp. S1727]
VAALKCCLVGRLVSLLLTVQFLHTAIGYAKAQIK